MPLFPRLFGNTSVPLPPTEQDPSAACVQSDDSLFLKDMPGAYSPLSESKETSAVQTENCDVFSPLPECKEDTLSEVEPPHADVSQNEIASTSNVGTREIKSQDSNASRTVILENDAQRNAPLPRMDPQSSSIVQEVPANNSTMETTQDISDQPKVLENFRPPKGSVILQEGFRNGTTPEADHDLILIRTEQAFPESENAILGTKVLSIPKAKASSMPNVVLFGETGTGKSSIINMLDTTSGDSAKISNGSQNCTFSSTPHVITLNGCQLQLWDTAGLNEGEQGTVPARQALENLRNLVWNLSTQGGISLLVYCLRGPRIQDIWRVNYDLFHGIICQGKVPVVACVTGLENEDPMEEWWVRNEVELKREGLLFRGHACVTASKGKQLKDGTFRYQEEYQESKDVVEKLLRRHCMNLPWKVEGQTWLSQVTRQLVQYDERQQEGVPPGSLTNPKARGMLRKFVARTAGWVRMVAAVQTSSVRRLKTRGEKQELEAHVKDEPVVPPSCRNRTILRNKDKSLDAGPGEKPRLGNIIKSTERHEYHSR